MPLAKERELIPVSSQAHKHLRAVVEAMKANGLPTNGTMLVSEMILRLSVPQQTPTPTPTSKPKRKPAHVRRDDGESYFRAEGRPAGV